MLEHMMFKGTHKVKPKEFSRIVQRKGGVDNAYTSTDVTVFHENFASDRLDTSLELESDRMHNLVLLDKEFMPEKKVVMEERRWRLDDNPVQLTIEEMMAAAFHSHPYHSPVIGWMEDLQNLTIDDVKDWYRQHYAPNRAFIVIAGDVEPEKYIQKVRKYFEDIPAIPYKAKPRIVEPPQRGERRVWLKKEAKLPFVFAGYHVPNLTDPDSYPLEVLAAILSGGKSSRLNQSLVYGQQIASFAGGEYDRVSLDPGLFYLYAEALPGTPTEKIEQALYDEIEKLKKEKVPEQEFQKVKNQLEAGFIREQDSVFSLAGILGDYEACSSWRDWQKYLPGVLAVTAADVQRVAQKYLIQDNRTVGILIPVSKPGQGGQAQTPGEQD